MAATRVAVITAGGSGMGADAARVVEFAAAAACLKHTIPGDFNLVSVEEVHELLRGGEAGRVRR